MNHRRTLLVPGLALVVLLMAACGTPAAPPTPVIIVITAEPQLACTPVVIVVTATPPATTADAPSAVVPSSATNESSPAGFSTPEPEATPAQDLGVVAVVTTVDGSVYALDHVAVQETYSRTSGFYQELDNFREWYVPVVLGPVALQIPLSEVESVIGDLEGASVMLVDGKRLEGSLGKFYRGGFRAPTAVTGRAEVSGFAADFRLDLFQLDSVSFFQDSKGEIAARVTAKDGSVAESVLGLAFEFYGGTTISGAQDHSYLPLQVGAAVVEIPLADIKEVQVAEGRVSVSLWRGEPIEGGIAPEVLLAGRTEVLNAPGEFLSSFGDIQSVVFQ